MTRRDFEAIAKILAKRGDKSVSPAARLAVREVTHDLCGYMGTTNANFNRERFLKAAGFWEAKS